ncbi:MAG: hypothetical protein KDK48_06410 [Chlamydiia bacterium]|nr:hypothetical protein [Chlamydiia bacterium]
MKKWILLTLTSSFLTAWDGAEVCRKYREGGYSTYLNAIDEDFRETLQSGGFDAFLSDRRKKLTPIAEELKKRMKAQKRIAKELRRINEGENHMLELAVKLQPGLRISRVVSALVEYNKAFDVNKEAVQQLALIEIGFVDMATDPVAFQVHELYTEYGLKESFINDDVLEGRIGQDKAAELAFVLQQQRDERIRKVCSAYPTHPTAKLCLQALEVNQLMLSFAGERKYLADLLAGMRAPENSVEQQVKEILIRHQTLRDELFKKSRK